MGITRSTNLQYRNKLVNGDDYTANPSDFASNLVGNCMTAVQCTAQVQVSWSASAQSFLPWNLTATAIEWTGGNFLDEGFFAGQEFAYIDGSGSQAFTASIDSISQDGNLLTFTVLTGTVTPATGVNDSEIRALGTASANQFSAIFYRFGLPTNNESFTFDSRISNTPQRYELANLTGSLQAMTPQGTLKDWQTGTAQARLVSTATYSQIYEVVHEFIIAPWVLEDQEDDIEALNPPSYFFGNECLRHCLEIELRPQASQPNGSITTQIDDVIGFTGWFDESGNGGADSFTTQSLSYQDTADATAVDSLQASRRTALTYTVQGAFTAGQRVGLLVSAIPDSSAYTGKTTTAVDNFLYDSLYLQEGTTATASGIIKEVSASLSGSDLTITAEIEYSAGQASLLGGLSYVLAVDLADPSLGVQGTNAVTKLVDVGQYAFPEPSALMTVDSFGFIFGEEDADTDTGTTDFFGWNQDAVVVDFSFSLDTSKQAVLNSLVFELVAYNSTTEDEFTLDRYAFDLSGALLDGNTQIIDIDTFRGYKYTQLLQYNAIELANGAVIGDLQQYDGKFAQKIRWEDWIRNQGANPVFFDNTQPNNNLNFKSSNYSLQEGYDIRMVLKANCTGLDDAGISSTVDYAFYSPAITVNDYGVEDEFTGTIETFDPDTLDNLGGILLSDKDTLIRATFTPTLAPLLSVANIWAAVRIDLIGNTGQQNSEISNSYVLPLDVLKPKTGLILLDVYLDSGNAVCECLVDHTKLSAGSFLITARVKSPAFVFTTFMNNDPALFMNGDAVKFMDQ